MQPGIRILVPFGRQKLIGILLSTSQECEYDPEKIKEIIRVLDQTSLFDPILFKLCTWASNYYQHPIGEVFQAALPVLLRQGEELEHQLARLFTSQETSAVEELKSSPRQLALHKLLAKTPQGLSKSEIDRAEFSRTLAKALVDKGMAEWKNVAQEVHQFSPTDIIKEASLTLNEEQKEVLDKVKVEGCHLIFGITGSGKTEVYLQAIESVIASGKQALVLVPEIGLTPQTVQRFKARFHSLVCVLHSGLSDAERLHAWRQAKQGGAAILIGTRSAIFTPLLKPGIIIIDEEHDASFKQQDGFRYSARDIAVLRGQNEKIPVILGSATPSLESYNNAAKGKYSLSFLKQRPRATKDTQYKIVGTQHEKLEDGFSKKLIAHINQHLAQGNQCIVFINRRGFSPVLLCQDCGWIAECTRCDARMTYHLSLNRLLCHHCGTQHNVYRQCTQCQSKQLVPLGLGTQRIEQSLNRLFPDQKVIRIDRDSTRKKGSLEKIMAEVNQGEPAILVGTQLLAKGHHFPNLTLVALVDIDSGFYSSDYRAIERMGQLLLQVGGRAGRESKPGTVVIQTQFPDQEILKTLIDDGYKDFCTQLLDERQQFHLPPFAYQAVIRAEANSPELAMRFLRELNITIPNNSSLSILGPVPSSMEKRAGKYRAQLLFTAGDRKSLQMGLSECIKIAEQSSNGRRVRWNVDVDPVDLF